MAVSSALAKGRIIKSNQDKSKSKSDKGKTPDVPSAFDDDHDVELVLMMISIESNFQA